MKETDNLKRNFSMISWFKKARLYSDKTIIQIIQTGSRKEAAAVYDYLYKKVFIKICHSRQARAILHSTEKREDAYHIAFSKFDLKVRGGAFKGKSTLSTFFTKIFLDECKDSLRRIQTGKEILNQPVSLDIDQLFRDLPATSQDVLAYLDKKTELEIIFKTLRAMNNSCHEIINLKTQGYRYAEIANILKMTTNSVKTTFGKCIKKLLKDLKGKLD